MGRNYVYKERIKPEHYKAEAFVVRCFDNRYWKVFKHFMKYMGLPEIDPESVAGGTKIFADPEKDGDRDFMLRELEKSVQLHDTKRVILFTHHDCGAYGGIKRFNGDEDKELEFHIAEHQKAIIAVKSSFPTMPIESYFIDREGVIKIH